MLFKKLKTALSEFVSLPLTVSPFGKVLRKYESLWLSLLFSGRQVFSIFCPLNFSAVRVSHFCNTSVTWGNSYIVRSYFR